MNTQTGAFLPGLLEQVGLVLETSDETAEGRKKSDEEILKLNVILVYKKLVQGLVYSPPDCDKYLALDAKPQVLAGSAPTFAPTVAAPGWQCWESVDVYGR